MVRSRYHGWILALGLLGPLVVAGCGNKPAPSPKHTVKKTAHNVKNAARSTSKSAKHVAKNAQTAVPPHSTTPAKPPVGNVAAGAKLFASTCESCHGKGGTGTGSAPRLASPSTVGAQFGTQAALESFIAHNMPANNPGSLNAQQAANAAAYVWHLAGK